MNQPSHTPGPWRVSWMHPGDKSGTVVSDGTEFNPSFVCSAQVRDATLIAAAPDFKSAAGKCVEWLELIKQSYPEMWSLIEGLTELKAAIAKAEGKA